MKQTYPFDLVPLPYDYDALEPYMDAETLHYHHDKHLKTYVDNLNNILKDYPQYQNWTLEDLLTNLDDLPEDIRQAVMNNAGGVYNHRFYFSNLSNPASPQPFGTLCEAIEKEFCSYRAFQDQFKASALSVFGSGYAWLVVNAAGKLCITTTANQDTPLPLGLLPVLNIDVWEHAYYLKHYNLRADYIDDWFHVINWNNANRNYMRYFSMGC